MTPRKFSKRKRALRFAKNMHPDDIAVGMPAFSWEQTAMASRIPCTVVDVLRDGDNVLLAVDIRDETTGDVVRFFVGAERIYRDVGDWPYMTRRCLWIGEHVSDQALADFS